jgi:hypothetical protein
MHKPFPGILNKEIPHFLEQNALFVFGLDKRIDGKKSSIELNNFDDFL